MANRTRPQSPSTPAVLLVPGLCDSGPSHWQTIWQHQRGDCSKVELGTWNDPHRNTWINNLNLAIRAVGRPVVLVAHSLGCLAVAWWARYEQRDSDGPVVGALMVAPPEVDFFPLDERVARFAPTPTETLPFPSRFVASHDDPWMGFHTAQALARRWGSELVDAGNAGHINADSGLGEWRFGQEQLELLLQRSGDMASARKRPNEQPSFPSSSRREDSEALPAWM